MVKAKAKKTGACVQLDLWGNPVEPKTPQEPQVITLDFETHPVRTVRLKNGEQWWVAPDVCRALGIRNSRDAVNGKTREDSDGCEYVSGGLDADEKGVYSADTLGGKQDLTIISEAGLYKLIFTSRKPEAQRFKRWVTHEVLPSIRRTGGYSLPVRTQFDQVKRKLHCDDETAKARCQQIKVNKTIAAEAMTSPLGPARFHDAVYQGQFDKSCAKIRSELGLGGHETPLDRMEALPMVLNEQAKLTIVRRKRDADRDGKPYSKSELQDMIETVSRDVSEFGLAQLGPNYHYCYTNNDDRGKKVIDVERHAPCLN